MYYLDEKQFKPMVIFLSFLFFPPIIVFGIFIVLEEQYSLLVLELLIIAIYSIIILMIRRSCNNKKNYLLIHDEMFEIYYPNIGEYANELKVDFCDIIEITYYRITSIRGWLQILGYVSPKCAYITYSKYGNKRTELMGFFDLNDIKKITNESGVKLKIK